MTACQRCDEAARYEVWWNAGSGRRTVLVCEDHYLPAIGSAGKYPTHGVKPVADDEAQDTLFEIGGERR